MPETAPEPQPHIPFAGAPPGNQSSFLQALLGRPIHVAMTVPGAQQTGILRAWDATTLTLELAPADTANVRIPMLVFKHGILTITPA